MFDKILVAVSSEHLPQKAMEKTLKLSKYFGADVEVIFIIEKKIEDKIQRASEYIRTEKQIQEMESEIEKGLIREFRKEMERWEEKFDESIKFNIKSVKGEFSKEIKKEIKNYRADLVIMEIQKSSIVKYHLLYEKTDAPILLIR